MMDFHAPATAVLRLLPAEAAHRATIAALKAGLGPKAAPDRPEDAIQLAGLTLPNRIGLAAGFDKNAEVPDAMLAAGFGFVECGTVTPRPQTGNPKPRLFRLPEDHAVINRMGFNNEGLEAFVNRLRARAHKPGVVGANIGANKDSENRIGDYCEGVRRVWLHAAYITINISSPNTPGLRALQTRAALEELLGQVMVMADQQTRTHGHRPIFLKVAPDLDDGEVLAIAETARAQKIDALIVSNTTIDRPDSLQGRHRSEQGGLSGRPVFAKSTRLLGAFKQALDGAMPLIGVGGIASAADAQAKFEAGADAIQLYTALVYEGPGLVQRIKDGLKTG
ncbi:dihydroorotate dehydrogenase (quinone) [Candidatus Phycosocius bacilliformis]|uniref:Dihydroorotate dehydrogenase (quinone) n=1 Tax=Candidatus Phycosocius bacilliformis TaxID=1445552 RepID=A0A2P2EE01_9PROT|nr:quinone-dependent dihydroorotate dehydrogenase [Candidatus Phycosocius bacilliformis]GBF59292.1 dihydroorotate dehydrogenase (quinone) [Candidatus Phycosocius bacilliformis]